MSDCHGRFTTQDQNGRNESAQQIQRHPNQEEEREKLVADLLDALDDDSIGLGDASILSTLEKINTIDKTPTNLFDTNASLNSLHEQYSMAFEPGFTRCVRKNRNTSLVHKFTKSFARIAAVAVICLGSVVAAQAAGIDVFGAVAHWTNDLFQFVVPNSMLAAEQAEVDQKHYSSLQEALDDYHIQEQLVPEIPERFKYEGITVRISEPMFFFYANYIDGGSTLNITLMRAPNNEHFLVEKDATPTAKYMCNNVDHYITSDNGREKAIWINGEWECNIYGNVSRSELIAMIDSIYSR